MSSQNRSWSSFQIILGAGLLAVAVVGVAAFVPRSRLARITGTMTDAMTGTLKFAARSPTLNAVGNWAVNLWQNTSPRAPVFNDLRPFDEF